MAGKSSSFLPRGGPAVTLFLCSGLTIGAVAYSLHAQVRDKAIMRAGVERDKERLRVTRQRQRDEAAMLEDRTQQK